MLLGRLGRRERGILVRCGSYGEVVFETDGFDSAEVITVADDVCAVIV